MRKEYKLILLILTLNLLFGYIFQLNNEVICFTELSFLGLGGLLFWLILCKPLKKITLQLIGQDGINTQVFLKLGGIGFVSSIANLFFCQLFLVVAFTLLFNCTSPSFNTLTASLTNNLAGNLLCYTALVGLVMYNHKSQTTTSINNVSQIFPQPDFPQRINDYLMLSHSKGSTKVFLKEISHIQVTNNCITIFTKHKKFVKYQSLSSFLKNLPSHPFIRVHRSTAINVDFIQQMRPNKHGDGTILLQHGVEVKFSRSYKKELEEYLR